MKYKINSAEATNPIESDNSKAELPKPIELDNRESELHKYIKAEWSRRTLRTDIPSELFSPLLETWIKEHIPLYLSNYTEYTIKTIYSGLIEFIVRERSLYEFKKYDLDDLTLWKKAMSEYSKNYSCLVGEAISIIPFILELKIEKCKYIKHYTPPTSRRYNEFKNKYDPHNYYEKRSRQR